MKGMETQNQIVDGEVKLDNDAELIFRADRVKENPTRSRRSEITKIVTQVFILKTGVRGVKLTLLGKVVQPVGS